MEHARALSVSVGNGRRFLFLARSSRRLTVKRSTALTHCDGPADLNQACPKEIETRVKVGEDSHFWTWLQRV